MSDHQISVNESIGMFEISRSVKPWDHLKDEVVAPMMEAARKYANLDLDGMRDLYLNDAYIARFMDKTGLDRLIDPPALGITEDPPK